eukprot:CAMPEP_0197883414 /NCGR_PEP_ID=MMETSP1439-20131203/10249_1 /TAXON_ID=66791 /ORGANISM="Gonyaulax spinifera, Strain CCMP409" /LENGTH=163 /DNA_ID=CAMNT_0043503133 /DNA_START=54 /DNA_END=542 /DNA_ORIENTATION=+
MSGCSGPTDSSLLSHRLQEASFGYGGAGSVGDDDSSKGTSSTKRMARQLVKTRFCKHFRRGYCRYQDKCAYAHTSEELMPRPNLMKTKICMSFLSGRCSNDECTYAHGLMELRQVPEQAGGDLQSRSLSPPLSQHGGHSQTQLPVQPLHLLQMQQQQQQQQQF